MDDPEGEEEELRHNWTVHVPPGFDPMNPAHIHMLMAAEVVKLQRTRRKLLLATWFCVVAGALNFAVIGARLITGIAGT